MTPSRSLTRIAKVAVTVAAGSTLIGTSCGQDVRDTLKAASLDFVKGSASQALTTFIPIKTILSGLTPSTGT